MKFIFGSRSKKQTEHQEEKTVLFVCVENAGRSQMAEGFFRKYAPRGYLTVSAGTKPSGEINPIAIQVMKELDIDISKQKCKIITEDMIKNSSIRVNMGCMEKESCPTLFLHNLEDWGIQDPKGRPIEKIREIRMILNAELDDLQQNLLKISQKITSNQRRFVAEIIGTFIVVVFATGSVVINAKMNGRLGVPFIAFAPFVGSAIGVYLFGRISMAHFNPALTIGFLITKHITKKQLAKHVYFEKEHPIYFVTYGGDRCRIWKSSPQSY